MSTGNREYGFWLANFFSFLATDFKNELDDLLSVITGNFTGSDRPGTTRRASY
jgi:hypothetical protein